MWSFRIETNWDITIRELIENKVFANQSVFGTFTLLDAWVKTYEPLRNMQIVTICGNTGDDGNSCVFPMCIWKRNWKNGFIRMLIPIGYSDYDYNEPLFECEPEDVAAFWEELQDFVRKTLHGQYDKIQIPGVRSRYCPKLAGWKQGECCPRLAIEEMKGEDDLFRFLKTSLRGDIRRQMRRLQELGQLTLHTYSTTDEVETTYEGFIAAHIHRWPNAYKAPGFHRNLLQTGLGHEVHFSSLDIDGKPIAWHLGFMHDGVYYYYMPCGNPDYQKFSPVKVHLFMLIAEAIKNGCTVYDHLRGEENYKQGWSDSADYVWMYAKNANTRSSRIRLFFGERLKTIIHRNKQ